MEWHLFIPGKCVFFYHSLIKINLNSPLSPSQSLAKDVVTARVNGSLYDLDRPLEGDATVEFVGFDSQAGQEVRSKGGADFFGEEKRGWGLRAQSSAGSASVCQGLLSPPPGGRKWGPFPAELPRKRYVSVDRGGPVLLRCPSLVLSGQRVAQKANSDQLPNPPPLSPNFFPAVLAFQCPPPGRGCRALLWCPAVPRAQHRAGLFL